MTVKGAPVKRFVQYGMMSPVYTASKAEAGTAESAESWSSFQRMSWVPEMNMSLPVSATTMP
jgi:hypothetical protein